MLFGLWPSLISKCYEYITYIYIYVVYESILVCKLTSNAYVEMQKRANSPLKNNLVPIKNVFFHSAKCIVAELIMSFFYCFIRMRTILMVMVMMATMVTAMVAGMLDIVYVDEGFADSPL